MRHRREQPHHPEYTSWGGDAQRITQLHQAMPSNMVAPDIVDPSSLRRQSLVACVGSRRDPRGGPNAAPTLCAAACVLRPGMVPAGAPQGPRIPTPLRVASDGGALSAPGPPRKRPVQPWTRCASSCSEGPECSSPCGIRARLVCRVSVGCVQPRRLRAAVGIGAKGKRWQATVFGLRLAGGGGVGAAPARRSAHRRPSAPRTPCSATGTRAPACPRVAAPPLCGSPGRPRRWRPALRRRRCPLCRPKARKAGGRRTPGRAAQCWTRGPTCPTSGPRRSRA